MAPDGTASRDSRLTLRSALVFADGLVGITEQVLGGFAVIKPWDSDASGPVFVNPVDDDYLASSLGPGPAVVANLRAYEPRALALSLPELPSDRDPGDLFPVVRPGYKGGTVVAAGGQPTIGLQLRVVDNEGQPLSMVAGELRPAQGGDAIPAFVGRDGRLRAQGLAIGDWELILQTKPVRRHALSLPADATGIIDFGTLTP
jgi:outer membrane usher protein